MTNETIILSTDIGFDPDDLVALLLLLQQPQLDLALIVSNEDPWGKRATFTHEIMQLLGRHIPVVRGNSLREQFGSFYVLPTIPDPAIPTDYLARMQQIVASASHVTFLSIGSLTEVADFFRQYPDPTKITLVQMGGNQNRPEHNFRMNLEATKFVFSLPDLPIRLVTSEITNADLLSVDSRSAFYHIFAARSATEPAFAKLMENINAFYSRICPAFNLHDPLTVATVIDPAIFRFQPRRVEFRDPPGRCKYIPDPSSVCHVTEGVDYDRFLRLMGETFDHKPTPE